MDLDEIEEKNQSPGDQIVLESGFKIFIIF